MGGELEIFEKRGVVISVKGENPEIEKPVCPTERKELWECQKARLGTTCLKTICPAWAVSRKRT